MRRQIKQEFMLNYHKCGVPYSVLLAPVPENLDRMMTMITIPKRSDADVIIEKSKQQNYIEGLKKVIMSDDLRSKGKLLVISSRDIDHLPNQIALSLAAFVMDNGKKFLWHDVYGGVRDDLRDDIPGSTEKMKPVSLLILSNLADNSTAMKIEKARDLLVRYSHINRIVVATGMNPAEYAKDVLRMRADGFLYF